MTSARLLGIQAKIERAKHHVHDLECRIKAFRETDPYRITCETDAQSGHRVFRVHIRSQLPADIPLIAGEAIHQLRSSLDHLAWQLVEANGEVPTKRTYFPICQTAAIYKAKFQGMVKGISPAAISILDSLQPYRGRYDGLGKLHELNIVDKHCLLLVVGYGLTRFGLSYNHPQLGDLLANIPAVGKFMADTERLVSDAPSRGFMITEDGAEVAEIVGLPDVNMNEEVNCTFDIAFGDPQIVKGEPILPFLIQLIQLVNGVINQFDRFL
jgi:hypothetical protein